MSSDVSFAKIPPSDHSLEFMPGTHNEEASIKAAISYIKTTSEKTLASEPTCRTAYHWIASTQMTDRDVLKKIQTIENALGLKPGTFEERQVAIQGAIEAISGLDLGSCSIGEMDAAVAGLNGISNLPSDVALKMRQILCFKALRAREMSESKQEAIAFLLSPISTDPFLRAAALAALHKSMPSFNSDLYVRLMSPSPALKDISTYFVETAHSEARNAYLDQKLLHYVAKRLGTPDRHDVSNPDKLLCYQILAEIAPSSCVDAYRDKKNLKHNLSRMKVFMELYKEKPTLEDFDSSSVLLQAAQYCHRHTKSFDEATVLKAHDLMRFFEDLTLLEGDIKKSAKEEGCPIALAQAYAIAVRHYFIMDRVANEYDGRKPVALSDMIFEPQVLMNARLFDRYLTTFDMSLEQKIICLKEIEGHPNLWLGITHLNDKSLNTRTQLIVESEFFKLKIRMNELLNSINTLTEKMLSPSPKELPKLEEQLRQTQQELQFVTERIRAIDKKLEPPIDPITAASSTDIDEK